jgi:hypothetical protein
MAIPTSPIPPDLASGDILKKGTAVVTIFIGWVSWAYVAFVIAKLNNVNKAVNLNVILIIDFLI